jgi:hypothetical protein
MHGSSVIVEGERNHPSVNGLIIPNKIQNIDIESEYKYDTRITSYTNSQFHPLLFDKQVYAIVTFHQ